MKRKVFFYAIGLIAVVLLLKACETYYFRNNYTSANKLVHETKNLKEKPFLKAHLKNGDICILRDTWSIDTVRNFVVGNGAKYDFNRTQLFAGELLIPIDSVVIFETNGIINANTRITTLAILAGVDLLVFLYCITNPKSCYGSCPTFYMNGIDNFHYADAEGFSNAILPSMEYFDIDALNNDKIQSDEFQLTMKNEAMETHCVNDVKLLVYPRKYGEKVYHTPDNKFYLCENLYKVNSALASEGNVTKFLKYADISERFSLADNKNLDTKEEFFLNFGNVQSSDEIGLILHYRQTLMTTYFIYNAMGYMGDEVSDFFAVMESNPKIIDKLNNGIKKELGNIDVYIWNDKDKNWEFQNSFFETGPIAINKQFIPLKCSNLRSDVKLKIVVNKGLWRIDYAAITNIKQLVKPIEIKPYEILFNGNVDKLALDLIDNPTEYLVTLPGDQYNLYFKMPNKNVDYELFLYSKGYYLEWMRASWLKDKNIAKLNLMLNFPKDYLKTEVDSYKNYEKTMEKEFWNSKFNLNSVIHYEK